MAENVKEFDWLASLVKNPDLGIDDFKKIGINPDNAELKSKSDYENLPQVKEAFKDNNGNFDRDAFDKFYDNALWLYNNYATAEYAPKALELYGYLDSQWDRPEGSLIKSTAPRFSLAETAPAESFGIDYINKYGSGPFAKQSAREIGQQQNVVDYETGETLEWTPDDKSGLIDALFRPTLVLASYDKDEYDANGNLLHKRGDLKYNDRGLPYYETLGGRSISGKQVLAYSDSITKEGSWLNKYDFFDSDDLDKSMIGTLTKTVFTVAPYLIPGVGEVLGAATAFEAINRVLPVLTKAIYGAANGDSESKLGETLNRWEGWMAKFDPSVSDKSQANLVTFENLGNLISSISGQLFQQRVVGSIPMLLNKSGDIVKQSQLGRNLSYTYMALTSAQDSFNTFKEAGASDMVAGWAFVANAVALGRLMATDYGKGLLFKGSWLDENVLREPARQAANEVRAELTKGIETAAPKQRAKFIQKLVDIYTKNFSSMAADTFVNRGMSEALEEVMEEGIIDVQKAITNVAEAIGVNVGEQKLDFGLSWNDILQRYGMAAAGGFIGGGIFHFQGKWDKFLANDMVQHTDEDTLQKLTYYIAQGRGQEIRDFYRQWHKKGLLGSTSLGTNLTTITSVNGSEVVSEPARNSLSQNDVVFNTMMSYIDSIESTISKEGLLVDTGSLVRNALNGYRETDKSLRGDTLINLGVHDLLIKDVYDVATKIVEKNAEIQSEIGKLTVKSDSPDAQKDTEENIKNSDKLKQLEVELQALRDRRDMILKGENNWKYVGQAIFASKPELAKQFIDLSPEKYSQVVLGRELNSLTEEEKADLMKKHAEYMKDVGKNKLLRAFDLYLDLSRKFAKPLLQQNEDLKGHSLNETRRVGTRFQEDLWKRLGEYHKISNEYGRLVAKQEKTEEDIVKISELKKQMEAMDLSFTQEGQNPYTMLIHPSQDNVQIVDLLSKGLLTSEQSGQAYALVKEMYQKYASDHAQLNNDYEYEALLRNTAADFLQAGSIEDRVDSWLSGIEYRESGEGQDMGLWTSWLMDNNLYDVLYNEDEDTTDYESEFIRNLKSSALDFIQNLGVNNKAALQALNQIQSNMKEKGFSKADIDLLLSEIVPEYVEAGKIKPVTDFIKEIDGLRTNIKYSSFSDLLQYFATDLLGERNSLVDLIENEKRKLANSPNLEDYIIRNPQVVAELEELIDLIKVVRGVVQGSVDKTNGSINSSKHGEDYVPLPEIDENAARILQRQSYDLENEILTLIGISKLNGQRALKVHEEIDKNMRGKFIHALINNPAFVEKFGKAFYTTDAAGNQIPIDIAKIANDLLQGKIDLSKPETADPGDLLRFEVAFETELYKTVTNTINGKDAQEAGKALVNMFPDAWNLDTTVMGTDTETITPYSLLSYLQMVLSLPAESFYTKYETVTQAEDSQFAPIYGQEMALRNVSAMIANPELANAILEQLANHVDLSKIDPKDKTSIKWISNLTTLPNIVIIPGGAGCGKTTAIATNTAKMYADYDHEFICLAPEMEQAENLAKAIGEGTRKTDKATFFKTAFNVDLQKYRFNDKTGHSELVEVPVMNDKVFDRSKKLKILFIDEVSLFTESELKLISDYAVRNGIVVVGLGDPVQNSAKVYTDEILTESGETKHDSEKTWYSSGLEDCIYFGSSYLTASLRTSNLAKFENFNSLSKALNDVMHEWRKQPWLSLAELNAFLPQTIKIKAFENDDIFYGDKTVEDDTDLKQLAAKYVSRGKVTIITDNLNKYQDLPEGVELKAYNKMQGMETDFVLVDVDFTKNNNLGGSVNKYSTLRDLYTITQRSRIGTIIKEDGLKSTLSMVVWDDNNPEVAQKVIMSEQDINVFKQKRGEILTTLNKSNDLFDYVYEFKTVAPSTPAVVPTNPTTPPPPVPPTTPPPPTPPTPPQVPPTTPPTSGGQQGTPGNGNGSNPPAGNPTGNPPAPVVPPGTPIPPAPGSEPVSYAQSAQAFTAKGSTRTYNSQFSSFVYGQDFKEFEHGSPDSLINWKNRNGGDKITIPESTYKKLLLYVSSGIRTELPVNLDSLLMEINDSKHNKDVDVSSFISNLKQVLSTNPELYVLPFNKDFRLITAVYRTANDALQFPIGLTKTTATGRYIGKFKRTKNIEKRKNNDTWRSLEDFKAQHPDILITPIWGVNAQEINLKEHNLGKVSIVMSDEPAYARYLENWYEPDTSAGLWISHYKDLCHMCIQKPVNPQTVLKFITSLKYRGLETNEDQKTINILMERGLWEKPQDIVGYLTGNDLINLPTGADKYRVLDSRAWQALPMDRALMYMRLGAQAAYQTPDFNNMILNMTAFMHFLFKPNQRVNDEKHALILSDGETSYIVKPKMNDEGHIVGYKATPYVNGTYIESNDDPFFQYKTKFPFVAISQQLFGKPIVGMEFARLVNFVGSDDYSLQHLSPNDNIFMLFGTQKYNWDQLTTKMVQDEFINGIYVNDSASEFLAPDGAFRKFTGNKEGYWIKGDVWGSVWEIDESAIRPLTNPVQRPEPDTKTPMFMEEFEKIKKILPKEYKAAWDQKLASALARVKAGENMDDVMNSLIQGINNNMAFTYNNWKGTRVVKNGDKYNIEKYDNFDLWLNRRVISLAKAEGMHVTLDDKVDAVINKLNTSRYAVIEITSPEGNVSHGVLIDTNGQGKYAYRPMTHEINGQIQDTYQSYMELQTNVETLGDILNPIKPYLDTLLFKYTTPSAGVDPIFTAQWISNHKAELGNFVEVLNNYLEQRILANEC